MLLRESPGYSGIEIGEKLHATKILRGLVSKSGFRVPSSLLASSKYCNNRGGKWSARNMGGGEAGVSFIIGLRLKSSKVRRKGKRTLTPAKIAPTQKTPPEGKKKRNEGRSILKRRMRIRHEGELVKKGPNLGFPIHSLTGQP